MSNAVDMAATSNGPFKSSVTEVNVWVSAKKSSLGANLRMTEVENTIKSPRSSVGARAVCSQPRMLARR
jgi:hypothetical protein